MPIKDVFVDNSDEEDKLDNMLLEEDKNLEAFWIDSETSS